MLRDFYGRISITKEVQEELNQPLQDWIDAGTLKTDIHKGLSGFLDKGEASIIALTAENPGSLLIIDELKGRKIAKQLGLLVMGTLGVLVAVNVNSG